MNYIRSISKYIFIGAFVVMCGVTGCTKKPNEEELTKLEEARAAAESAERKLSELRQERMSLESQLEQKKSALGEHEAEREDLKQKMEERGQE